MDNELILLSLRESLYILSYLKVKLYGFDFQFHHIDSPVS
jgi:hypothetical protein